MMAKPKATITTKQLLKAYKLKKEKKPWQEITKEIGISMGQYSRNREKFNAFFDKKRRESANKRVKDLLIPTATQAYLREREAENRKTRRGRKTKGIGRPHVVHEETDIDLETLKIYVAYGLTQGKIASMLGMSTNTFKLYCEKFPAIALVMKHAKEMVTTNLLASMIKQSHDREVEDTYAASWEGNINTERIKKFVPGNAQLMKYAMSNLGKWTTEPQPDTQNNKGAIMSLLSKLTEDEEDEDPLS